MDTKNTSIINASTTSAARASDAIGVVVAFNTIGWEAQNLLFNAIDALIGSPEVADAFGAENPAEVLAYIQDSTVNAAGDVIVHAENLAQLNAALANENVSSVANTLVLAAVWFQRDVRNRNAGQQQGEQPDPTYIDFTGSQGTITAGSSVRAAQDRAKFRRKGKWLPHDLPAIWILVRMVGSYRGLSFTTSRSSWC